MSSDLSDDDFCETNFCEPSPVKRCNFLPSAKDRNLQEVRKEALRKRIIETEKECLNVIANSLKVKDDELLEDKILPKSSEVLLFSPQGRTFFEPEKISKDNLQPFLWLNNDSQYYEMNLDEFMFHIPQLTLTTEGEKEKNKLIKFCLNLLIQETEVPEVHFLTKFLSQQFIPFNMITFKEWGGLSLPFLIRVISKSVSNYRAEDAKDLFKQACLSALDTKTFSLTSELRELISSCLLVFAVQFNVLNEIDWLISLELKPEEGFRIIEVLPVSGLYADLNLRFAWKFLPSILELQSWSMGNEVVTWHNLVRFVEENESKIRSLSPNYYFCFMYIMKFIVIRLPEDEKNFAEILLKLLDNLKLHFGQEKGNMSLSHYLSMEAMNRLYLICNELKSKK
ncbi:uncharacterized protein [Halyomorpha halys]|uniref:uncharacterized protein isoform X1 n=1 Tax=Halyomorpha halys TaxID=286706 RepID=UPI0006D4F3D6|nr:uncharacterized protein LOC106685850 [Halyomorpha halys]